MGDQHAGVDRPVVARAGEILRVVGAVSAPLVSWIKRVLGVPFDVVVNTPSTPGSRDRGSRAPG